MRREQHIFVVVFLRFRTSQGEPTPTARGGRLPLADRVRPHSGSIENQFTVQHTGNMNMRPPHSYMPLAPGNEGYYIRFSRARKEACRALRGARRECAATTVSCPRIFTTPPPPPQLRQESSRYRIGVRVAKPSPFVNLGWCK